MVEIQRWVLDAPTELRTLRASLYQALTGLESAGEEKLDDVPEKMLVVATELATNALRHGMPPTIVRLCRADDDFVLDVADQDPDVAPEFAVARPPGAGGLGLQLARNLSLEIGWYTERNTKHVWASFRP
jgi:two-component sensor histidine kinase